MAKIRDCTGEYGIVKIIKGKYKGRFGYYDDDDYEEGIKQAVVYFGDILHNSRYVCINSDYITNDYTVKDLQNRSEEIYRLLFDQISDSLRVSLVEEKRLIDMQIIDLSNRYIESNKEKNLKVFLSHSSKDKPTVISVALDLEKRGFSSWLDAFDIIPGESIMSKIEEGLEKCDLALLFLSKDAIASSWVNKEWETMMWDEINFRKIKIIPIKLDNCEIPKILQTKKYIDFSTDYNQGLFQLIDALQYYEKQKLKGKDSL